MKEVLYDGDCPFCLALTEGLRQELEPKGWRFAPLQEEGTAARLGLNPEDLLLELKVMKEDGTLLGGAPAVAHLAGMVPWGWPVRLLARAPGGMNLLKRVYTFIANQRACVSGVCARTPRIGWVGWAPVLLLPMVAIITAWRSEGWILMWAVAVTLFAGCKWLSWWDAFLAGQAGSGRRWLAYLTRWVGMDARTFLDEKIKPQPIRLGRWLFAAAKTLLGAAFVWVVARQLPDDQPLLQGWVAMTGGIFFAHFGLFHLLALEWQRRGIMAEPIMNAPIAAQSLGEFWGRRWNRGFNDLVRRYSFYPLVPRFGVINATLATFLASGLIHDLVVSVPARTGYGLPTAYFLIQGLGVIFERSSLGRKLGLRHGLRGRLFTYLVTIGPAGMLFFPRFVEGVVLPFLKFIKAL